MRVLAKPSRVAKALDWKRSTGGAIATLDIHADRIGVRISQHVNEDINAKANTNANANANANAVTVGFDFCEGISGSECGRQQPPLPLLAPVLTQR